VEPFVVELWNRGIVELWNRWLFNENTNLLVPDLCSNHGNHLIKKITVQTIGGCWVIGTGYWVLGSQWLVHRFERLTSAKQNTVSISVISGASGAGYWVLGSGRR
jgi:hypothetical protein